MAGHWAGTTYWVTGASSGIGKAVAHELFQNGARVILSARRQETLEELVNEWGANPDQILVLPLDLSQSDTLAERARAALSWAPRLDGIVHCGGISQRSLAKETSLEVDRQLMEVDYFGTVGLTKALLPHFLAQGSAKIAVVTSLMGLFSSPLRSGYCAAKHALHGFFEALRAEHHNDGLRITLVCPGFIHTEISMNARVGDGSLQGTMDEKTGKGLSPEECASQILRAMRHEKPLVMIGRGELLGAYLARWAPNLLRKWMRKVRVT
jgi:dehydrogenase/reductase SDR family protein 7B